MSCKLAFAPDRVKASLATSGMRSRLRCASARGLSRTDGEPLAGIVKKKLAIGYSLHLFALYGADLRLLILVFSL
jgi:hypothetical protein